MFGAGAGAGVVEDGPSFVFGSAAAALRVAPAANNDFVTGTSMDAVPAVEPFPSCCREEREENIKGRSVLVSCQRWQLIRIKVHRVAHTFAGENTAL